MEIYTIGFTKKSAEQFFETLKRAGVEQVIDIRRNNTSQLAGFTKKPDLIYFLKLVGPIDYIHLPILAPTKEILTAFKKSKGSWEEYEAAFNALLRERQVEKEVPRSLFDKRSALLCSEPTADHCHRRLVAEYLAREWGGVEVRHL